MFDVKGKIAIMACAIFCMSLVPFSNASSQDKIQKINRDIEIMEAVLDKLLRTGSTLASFQGGTKGTYLEGYGVMFTISYGSLGRGALVVETTKDETDVHRDEIIEVFAGGTGEAKDPEERLAELKENLITFFSDYAGAMKDLNADDLVTVVVDFNGSSELFLVYATKTTTISTKRLIATATFDDIQAVSRGSMAQTQFEKKVTFKQEEDDRGEYKDFDILADIFDTALKRSRRWQTLSFSGKSRSMYFPGFGAVFVTDAIFPSGFVRGYTTKILDGQFVMQDKKEEDTEEQKSDRELIEQLKNDIIDILGRYGASLRTVPENEYVMITVDLSRHFESNSPNKLLIKSQMNDIKRFNRDELSFDRFKNAIQIKEY